MNNESKERDADYRKMQGRRETEYNKTGEKSKWMQSNE